ncbi:MAG: hypothetical protein ACRENI_01910 [Gemmatimonadaceae bacterium]
MKVWLLEAGGGLRELEPADPKKPMKTPSRIAVPEFHPDPAVEDFAERIYHRFEITKDSSVVGYVYAERKPSREELARILGA